MRKDCVERIEFLRNVTNYNADSLIKDYKITGIKEISIFNTLHNFHVTKNIGCDIMHDIYLGVCKYDLSVILDYFIYKEKVFSLEQFNYIKQTFDYGYSEIGNISPPIEKTHIQSSLFKINARQMRTLIHFMPVLIGGLVRHDNQVYKFLITLVKLIDILLLPRFDEQTLDLLQCIIQSHNEQYQELFNLHLKPKFHNMVHYPTIIRNLGPIKYLSCFRFEAEHKLHKTYAHNITSRLNIPLSLAIKASLRFSCNIVEKDFFQEEYVFNSDLKSFTLNQMPYFSNIINIKNITNFPNERTNSILFRGITFRVGNFLSVTKGTDLKIYQLTEITLHENNQPLALCVEWEQSYFSEHFQSVIITIPTQDHIFLNFNNFDGPPVHYSILRDLSKAIRLKKYW